MHLIPFFAARRPLATCAAAVLAAGLSVGVAVAPPHLSDPGPGQAVVTAQFIAAQKAVQASIPTIAGTPKVGVRLTANPRAWTPGTRLTYQWYAGGKAVKGATARTFTPGAAHVNKPIQVRVVGSKAGYASAAKMSRATGKVAKGTLKAPTPTIAGTAKSGVKLTANPGAWTSGTALKYQWLAGGAAVKGATARTFTPAAAHVGKAITVRVTGSKAGYVTLARASKATGKVALAAPVILNPRNGVKTPYNQPFIIGTAPLGATVTVYIDGAKVGTSTSFDHADDWMYGYMLSSQNGTYPQLANGVHTIAATATVSGATSARSNTVTFSVSPTGTTSPIPGMTGCGATPASKLVRFLGSNYVPGAPLGATLLGPGWFGGSPLGSNGITTNYPFKFTARSCVDTVTSRAYYALYSLPGADGW